MPANPWTRLGFQAARTSDWGLAGKLFGIVQVGVRRLLCHQVVNRSVERVELC